MSRASKAFFGTSVVFMAATVYGVHWMQQRESDNMYLGVIRDEERVRAKAEEKARLATLGQKAVTQPASVVDEDCATKEERARERQARLLEYEQQKGLAQRLETTQGKGASTESARLV